MNGSQYWLLGCETLNQFAQTSDFVLKLILIAALIPIYRILMFHLLTSRVIYILVLPLSSVI